MNSTMEEQKIRFSSGFHSFCLKENLRGFAHLRGRISAVIADIGLRRKAQIYVENLADCLGIVNSEDTGLEF